MAGMDSGMGQVFGDIIATDVEIREEVRDLARMMLRHVRYVMKYGDDPTKNNLMRAMVPGMLKALAQADGGQREVEEKEAIQRLMQRTLTGKHTIAATPDVDPTMDHGTYSD